MSGKNCWQFGIEQKSHIFVEIKISRERKKNTHRDFIVTGPGFDSFII